MESRALTLGGGRASQSLRFSPFRHPGHGLSLILGKGSGVHVPLGKFSFSLRPAALSGTVGMGSVAGYGCSVSGWTRSPFFGWFVPWWPRNSTPVLWRCVSGWDEDGVEQGPMYLLARVWVGVGNRLRSSSPPAVCSLPAFLQSNQLTQIVRSMFLEPKGSWDRARCFGETGYSGCCWRFSWYGGG